MKLSISSNASVAIKSLENRGFEAFFVGGCVRDMLMGKIPSDYDITTNALPHQIKSCFENTIDTGLSHGTVTAIVNGEPFEITTYRTESDYSDMRRPDSVKFVRNIEEDLARRDFTVNAVAYNEKSGFKDPFCGINDIESGILRAVGDPEKRFREDALRIMRLFRFAATLNMKTEEKTKTAAVKCADELKFISCERIYSELTKLACGSDVEKAEPLFESGTLKPFGIGPRENLKKISKLAKSSHLRLYALLSDASEDKYKTLDILKAENAAKEYFKHMDIILISKKDTRADIKRILGKVPYETVLECAEYTENIRCENAEFLKFEATDIINRKEPYKISDLAISGNDLKALGYSGAQIGEKLKTLLDKVIEDPKLNRKDTLLSL